MWDHHSTGMRTLNRKPGTARVNSTQEVVLCTCCCEHHSAGVGTLNNLCVLCTRCCEHHSAGVGTLNMTCANTCGSAVGRNGGQSDRRSAGSAVGRSGGRPDRRSAGSAGGRIGDRSNRRPAGSAVNRIGGRPDERSAGRAVGRTSSRPDERSAGSAVGRMSGRPDRRWTADIRNKSAPRVGSVGRPGGRSDRQSVDGWPDRRSVGSAVLLRTRFCWSGNTKNDLRAPQAHLDLRSRDCLQDAKSLRTRQEHGRSTDLKDGTVRATISK